MEGIKYELPRRQRYLTIYYHCHFKRNKYLSYKAKRTNTSAFFDNISILNSLQNLSYKFAFFSLDTNFLLFCRPAEQLRNVRLTRRRESILGLSVESFLKNNYVISRVTN